MKKKFIFTNHAREQFKRRFTELWIKSSVPDRTLRQLILACDMSGKKLGGGSFMAYNGRFGVVMKMLDSGEFLVLTVLKPEW